MTFDHHPSIQTVDRILRDVRFEPRPSLQAELLGRVRRDGGSPADERSGVMASGTLLAALAVLAALLYAFWARLLALADAPR